MQLIVVACIICLSDNTAMDKAAETQSDTYATNKIVFLKTHV